jgi:Flp pilus assembly secretin CpaC
VRTAPDRPQINLGVKIAEVRRDLLAQLGVSTIYSNGGTRVGTNQLRTDAPFTGGQLAAQRTAASRCRAATTFTTVVSDFNIRNILGIIEAEEQRGRARLLAEPNLTAANRDSASFLAGGEIPIPIAQPGAGGQTFVTLQYREFGVRLTFAPEVLNDSLVKLRVRPEVSDLDFANSITLSGFRIPALRTRRVETSVDVPRDRSFIISGLFNNQREQVRTGHPDSHGHPDPGQPVFEHSLAAQRDRARGDRHPDGYRPAPSPTAGRARLQPDAGLPAREAIEPRVQPGTLPPAPARRP